MRNKEFRIAQKERFRTRNRRLYSYLWNIDENENKEEILSKLDKTRTPCSCWMCGNRRKWFKEKTKQEKIIEIKERQD